MTDLLLRDVRVFDPGSGLDATGRTVSITNGRITSLDAPAGATGRRVVNGRGRLCIPGLVDLRTNLCEPGFTRRESIATGVRAAARGGYTTLLAMPETDPTIDRVEVVELIVARAARAGTTRVWPVGAVSVARKGKRLSEMAKLAAAGCVAFTDGNRAVRDSQLLRYALEAAGELSVPIISHAEDVMLSLGGVMHEGVVSTRLGLVGVPGAAEVVGVARDIAVAALTGSRLHLAHVSTGEAVALIRQAKSRGVKITAEVSPLHLSLTDEAVNEYDTRAKVFPPLRPQADVDAVLGGLSDGTIDAVASDHTPQSRLDKNKEFDKAAPGAIALESTLGVVLGRVGHGLTLERAIAVLTRGPANVLDRRDVGRLGKDTAADLVLLDPDERWNFALEDIASRSANTPLMGAPMRGRVHLTVAQGEITYERGAE